MTGCGPMQCLGEHLGASRSLAHLTGRRAGGVHVFDARFRLRTRLPRHEHPHARFSFILAGSIGEIFDENATRCDRNTLCFHPATVPHGNEFGAEGARAILIEVCPEVGSDLAHLAHLRTTPFAIAQRSLRDLAIDLSRALREHDPLQSIAVEAIALDFLSRAMPRLEEPVRSRNLGPPSWLDDLDRFLEARLDRPLSVADAAARMHVTPRRFAAALQRNLGTTFVALLRRRRVERAKSLLLRSDLPLSSIALASGFADQSHLTRCFHALVGTTPARFRRQSGTQPVNPF